MPPLPKRKLSKARKGRRRSHDGLQALQLVKCPNCGAMRRSHQVCPKCGQYRGETVIEMKAEKKD
ncbi:MAG TPA: 50S ribosomal protein L32 [Anaerolineae bacterium]